MSSKYIDIPAIVQVIGNVFNNPSLLDMTDKYTVTEEDFVEDFHKIVFGSIYKIYELGAEKVSIENISDFLSSRPKNDAVFKTNKGEEWLLRAAATAQADSFDYYYNRMKKMSLLRAYDTYGIDVSFIYDPDNIFDSKKKQQQEDFLDNSTLEDIASKVDDMIEGIKLTYVEDVDGDSYHVGEGLEDLVDKYKESPEVGIPMFGSLINTVTRGARLKKFYLRSAPTGVGKSRTLVADACNFACNKLYNETFGMWLPNGKSEPTLFISTEQELEEVQTMMLAFLSAVPEDHILNGKYIGDEEQRVRDAIVVLKESPLYIELLPDFSLRDVENTIRKNIRDNDVKYIVFDYIHTSMKILEEITKLSGGVKLREENILFMMSIRLKDICNQYGVFIISATQLNSSYEDSETPDQNLLRGAKSIADKIDCGMILLPVKQKDLESLGPIIAGYDTPTLKLSIYKNRRGRYKGVYLWCKANLGTCRVEPMFCTTYNYELVDIQNIKIIVEEEKGAF